jgi:DSF synthase
VYRIELEPWPLTPSHLTFRARSPESFGSWRFPTVDVEYDPHAQALWMLYSKDSPPFFSLDTLQDVGDVRASVRALFASPLKDRFPIRYFLMASNKPSVFNLGGDLAMFAKSIRDGDRDKLRLYAHTCVDLVHSLTQAFDLPIVTLSVIAGQALGGGFEGALAEDFIVADEEARIGLPEVSFNTFPGMGAMTLLSRRLGAAAAEDLIASGKVHDGRSMYEAGVVDILAPAGAAHQTATAWMAQGGQANFERRLAIAGARRRLFPVSHHELARITDLWVDCSCDVTAHDVRHMERLAAAQKRLNPRASSFP